MKGIKRYKLSGITSILSYKNIMYSKEYSQYFIVTLHGV